MTDENEIIQIDDFIGPPEKSDLEANNTSQKKHLSKWSIVLITIIGAFASILTIDQYYDIGWFKFTFFAQNQEKVDIRDQNSSEKIQRDDSKSAENKYYDPLKYTRADDLPSSIMRYDSFEKASVEGLFIRPNSWYGNITDISSSVIKISVGKPPAEVNVMRSYVKNARALRNGDYVNIEGTIFDVSAYSIFVTNGKITLSEKPPISSQILESDKNNKCVQRGLNRLGAEVGPIDGKFGKNTSSAYADIASQYKLIKFTLPPITSPKKLCLTLNTLSKRSFSEALTKKIISGEFKYPNPANVNISKADEIIIKDKEIWEKYFTLKDQKSALNYVSYPSNGEFTSEAIRYISNTDARKSRLLIAMDELGVKSSFRDVSYNYSVTAPNYNFEYGLDYNFGNSIKVSSKYLLVSNCMTRAHALSCYMKNDCTKADYDYSKKFAKYSNTCLELDLNQFYESDICDKIGNSIAKQFGHNATQLISSNKSRDVCINAYTVDNFNSSNWDSPN